jgi:YggT family protein
MLALCYLVNTLVNLIFWIVIGQVILSWLLHFQILNANNRFVYQIYLGLEKITEPLFSKIRKFIPTLGGLDLAPVVLLIGIEFLRILFIANVCMR